MDVYYFFHSSHNYGSSVLFHAEASPHLELVSLRLLNMSELHGRLATGAHVDAFKQAMFPDAKDWDARCNGEVWTFTRGPLLDPHKFVAHGTPLSSAHLIIAEGFRVGPGQHMHNGKPMHGIFCMQGGPPEDRIEDAIDRSTSNRCTEFQKMKGVSGWTTPCAAVRNIQG